MAVPGQDIKGRLAVTDEEAGTRFGRTAHADPFPDIPPALLNSADLIDYVVETGMIHPFRPEEGRLKPASYAVPLLGKAVWWDADSGDRKLREIKQDDDFVLQPSAIAFVTLEPMFRLPDYIALRFNLKIRNIYRGLLLGTGPLVDPGFCGHLSLPLHNLTTNPYHFRGGDDLIWMEFTKLSPHTNWVNKTLSREGRVGYYAAYKKRAGNQDVETYIEEAVGQQQVVSSISQALREARSTARTAKRWTVGGVVGGGLAALALIGGMVALIVNLYMLRGDAPSRADFDRQRAEIVQLDSQVEQLLRERIKPE
jgi:deoxycytidine triphosphate deaminase